MGMTLAPNVVTEAGFGSDLGAEKFFDIKCVGSGLSPKCMVLVATIRALKYHGGADLKSLKRSNPAAVSQGLCNLEKHLENSRLFNIPAIVAINKFVTDTAEEINIVQERCEALGFEAVVADVWSQGGEGARDLATVVSSQIESSAASFTPLYDWNLPVREKISTICKEIYGADAVEYSSGAQQNLKTIKRLKLEGLPICIAKTQKSLSDNPTLIGRPTGFSVTVREIEIATGAGFLVPITGDMMRMPGLPATPAAEAIDIDEEGQIIGLF